MPNTSSPWLEESRTLHERLDQLGRLAPGLAEQLRPALAGALPLARPAAENVPPVVVVAEQATAEAPLLLVVMGTPPVAALQKALDALPARGHLLLLEMEPAYLARLFAEWPLEQHLQAGRLGVCLGADESRVEAAFVALVDMRHAPIVRLLELAANTAEEQAFYHRALLRAHRAVHLNSFNLGTLVSRGPLWQHNTICNLPALIRHPGIAELAGIFAGRPAIVAGAGPSLTDAIPYISQARERFVLIATGTALRPLRAAGIRPDMVMSVDGSHKTGPQFQTVCEDLYLACSSLVYPPILPRFKGIFSASMTANPISEWLNLFGRPKGTLIAAGTVTTTAADLAVHMGCGPVVLVGTDLSFKDDGTTHAHQTMYHGSRLDPQKLIRVPGNYQAEVLTTEQFKCYINLLEDYVRSRANVRFINATAGGARIQGLELGRPEQIAQWAGEPVDAYGRIEAIHQGYRFTAQAEVLAELRQVAGQLADLQQNARQAAMVCNQIMMILRAPHAGDEPVLRGHLEWQRELDEHLAAPRASAIFLDMSLWPASYQSGAAREEHERHLSDALFAQRRARTLYESLAGAAKWTLELLQQAISQLDAPVAAATPAAESLYELETANH